MAAAALSRNQGVAGVRNTKGLFFIFSLLCLVCLASSLIDKEQLKIYTESLKEQEQRMESLKAESEAITELISPYLSLLNQMTALVKKDLPDFPELHELMEKVMGLLEKTKERNDKLGARMVDTEQQMGNLKKFITFLEEQAAEL